ncbi:Hypothetical Protein FCC1311_016992 [Hondaea fermentalgiana]|uniref:Uncharacterized protein n=1 Tax=Hondaea fermentalgiana TaxID=2315210 RepID=A0A2R5G398_9STRA|nr:Hypothetical Protein FCC1311_016992 [Hondaea fermentalgiana]|eukprot:GBG25480.1 Hypothetical Protein FCC1311_016992 [Hondaea fermentalgiana]
MGGKKSKPAEADAKAENGPRKCSKCYLMTLNSLIIAAGLVMISLSAWLGVEYKGLSDFVSATVIWTPLGLGFGLIFVGLLGLFGALYQNRCSLCLFIFFSAFLLVGCMVIAIFLFIEINNVDDVADVSNSAEINDSELDDVNTFEALVFNNCCYEQEDQFGDMEYEVELCPCSSTTSAGCTCFNDQVTYDYQNKHFDQDYCSVLQDLYIKQNSEQIYLIGNVEDGGCGGGDPKVFQRNMATYAEQSLKPGAAALLIVSIVMLVGVFFACFFFLLPVRKPHKYDKMDTEKRRNPKLANDEYGQEFERTESDRLAARDDDEGMIQMT